MEASFCGPKAVIKNTEITENKVDLNYHFTANDLMDIGEKLC